MFIFKFESFINWFIDSFNRCRRNTVTSTNKTSKSGLTNVKYQELDDDRFVGKLKVIQILHKKTFSI